MPKIWLKIPLFLTLIFSALIIVFLLKFLNDNKDNINTVQIGKDVVFPIGEKIDLETSFTDENNKSVQLKEYFDGKLPVVLSLVYYECPYQCTVILSNLTQTLDKAKWLIGKDFRVVILSINHREDAELAKAKKETQLSLYTRKNAAVTKNWHFLTGTEENIKKLAQEINFIYQWDETAQQYAHASRYFLLDGKAKLTHSLSGLTSDPKTLELAITESSEHKLGNLVDKFILFCYHFDPQRGIYAPFMSNIMKLLGLFTIITVGSLIILLLKFDSRRV